MIDFTSVLYLGLRHPSRVLRPWEKLTTGVPAALAEPDKNYEVAQTLAELQRCERVTFVQSTLHLFWDLFSIFERDRIAVYMDSRLYPIARWGVERVASRVNVVRTFQHHDARALAGLLKQDAHHRNRPVVVTDGFCPRCGKAAPVNKYLEDVRRFGGRLVIDDTQALGILGHSPAPNAPYGRGGGGILRWKNIDGPDVLLASSLAKGFGVPMAVLSGSNNMIKRFSEYSKTRVHCSPPSAAVVHAAEHALAVNNKRGDKLRLRLAKLVSYFRKKLVMAGFSSKGGLFPVQTLGAISNLEASIIHKRLLHSGVRTVPIKRSEHRTNLGFIIRAQHSPDDIDYAVDALEKAFRKYRKQTKEMYYEVQM